MAMPGIMSQASHSYISLGPEEYVLLISYDWSLNLFNSKTLY